MTPRTRIRGRDLRAASDDTPAIDLDERDLQKGRYFEATCQGTDLEGDFVRVTGEAGLPTVEKVDPLDLAKMPALGVILVKISATNCVVATIGELAAVGLTAGAPYWIGTDGRLSVTVPDPPASGLAVVQSIGRALTATRLQLGLETRGIRRGSST